MSSTTVSCPGKVLLAGGYLVLERPNPGLVVSTQARFYAHVRQRQSAGTSMSIRVHSPQFSDGSWGYRVKISDSRVEVTERANDDGSKNKFVHLALTAALNLAVGRVGPEVVKATLQNGLKIWVLGDNEFYSQSEPRSTLSPFSPLNVNIADVHKTGLGSSAAMVSSLVAALLVHFKAADVDTREGKFLIHNLAQYAHSLAQGKIGSGFDVSAAVWGSQAYTRFDPSCLSNLLDKDVTKISPHDVFSVVSPDSNPSWRDPNKGALNTSFALPPLTTLILADVDAGSHTPSMVSKVMSWKNTDKEAPGYWNATATANSLLEPAFSDLWNLWRRDERSYRDAVTEFAKFMRSERIHLTIPPHPNPTFGALEKVATRISTIRSNMRKMGQLSKVPIEPPEQQKLLDECTKECPGVLGGGVPGAGGYDAIWLLVLTPEDVPATKVEKFLISWDDMTVRPLARVRGGDLAIASGISAHAKNAVDGLQKALDSRP